MRREQVGPDILNHCVLLHQHDNFGQHFVFPYSRTIVPARVVPCEYFAYIF